MIGDRSLRVLFGMVHFNLGGTGRVSSQEMSVIGVQDGSVPLYLFPRIHRVFH
jgi:hypothetical protein